MRKPRTEKKVLSLDRRETILLITAMVSFRNRVLREGGPTEDLDGIICRLARHV